MPWKVKTFILVNGPPENETLYDTREDAEQDADQVMFMQPGEVIASVVECDDDGEEV